MKTDQVRQVFLDFFKARSHEILSSAPVVPQDDPTLLFTNAGMNQFKDVFLGQGSRAYKRVANSQLCIRVSGKHNDLEEVGRDTYHLTLFEMLGNWSFGDYYKKEAIAWAWELVTTGYGLAPDRLYATIHTSDEESAAIWQQETAILHDHILVFGDKENFWEMGATGPCGPCSEIHLDRGPLYCDKPGLPGHSCRVNGDCGRYIELWNLVFIQFNRHEDRQLSPLPETHVDTGAGLERIAAYLQGTSSAYEIDIFQPIIEKIALLLSRPYQDDLTGMPHRVLADHCRTLAFAIADNVMPSNEGRGYVLRRILRRGLRYARLCDVREPIIHKLVAPLIQTMGHVYPQLVERQAFIESVILAEEESFLRTLETGLQHFSEVVAAHRSRNLNQISGPDLFKLYDTFGFPLDLTQLMAEELGMAVDVDGFERALAAQREQSRKARQVHVATYGGVPKGGEARVVEHEPEVTNMARHHTGTHLLHEALRQVLGTHVQQAGSLVDVDRLRFDFTHPKPLTEKQLEEVQQIVKQKIVENIAVQAFEKPIVEAKALGALALFGEKYDDVVRVIQIGDFSMELCGGHHVPETAVIESLEIIHESGIAAGVRRIEAIAGNVNIEARQQVKRQELQDLLSSREARLHILNQEIFNLDSSIKIAVHTPRSLFSLKDLESETEQVSHMIRDAEKQVLQIQQRKISQDSAALLASAKVIGDTNWRILAHFFSGADVPTLRAYSDVLMNGQGKLILVLAGEKSENASVLVKLSDEKEVPEGYEVSEIIRRITEVAGGRGGGKGTLAQAGGLDAKQLRILIDEWAR